MHINMTMLLFNVVVFYIANLSKLSAMCDCKMRTIMSSDYCHLVGAVYTQNTADTFLHNTDEVVSDLYIYRRPVY